MLQRKLTAALVLEDDATLPTDLWVAMERISLPPTAQLFWMGSYSRRTNVGTLASHPFADGTTLSTASGSKSKPVAIHKRNGTMFPPIFGAGAPEHHLR